METTYADVSEGTRVDISVEVVSRRAIDVGDVTVRRVSVRDRPGTEFVILIAPGTGLSVGLETGRTFRFEGLIGARPNRGESASVFDCPACGERLRSGHVADAYLPDSKRTLDKFGIEGLFAIADERTDLHRVGDDEALVDDWIPMADPEPVSIPDFVCNACGRQVNRHELADRSGVDHSPAAAVHAGVDSITAEMSTETVGLAAGGAKAVVNFRKNVDDGYTPQPEAISDEGLFYDYHFETGEGRDTDALFSPRYVAAVSDHPLTGETEHYLSVGLDSTLSVDDFKRPPLDLVAVLDVSGSMRSPFAAYYYDERGRRHEPSSDESTTLDAATRSLCVLTEQLHDEDRLGVVLYNHRAHVAKPLRDVGGTDMPAIRRDIRRITAGGSTNLSDGYEAAMDMLTDAAPDPDVERRVVFLTDRMPNACVTNEDDLTGLFADAASRGIHTTFVGMGIDANAELVDALSAIRGANHYFVHSAEEFQRRLGEEFDFMVTPLVFDLSLELEAEGYEVAAVYGSPSADPANDRLVHVGTLFPSAKADGDARGGVVLVRLEQTGTRRAVELVASWTERDGEEYTERVDVALPDDPETFEHDGVRKAVALSRYTRELRAWASDVHDRNDAATGVDDWLFREDRGEHERESVPLVVPHEYVSRFQRLLAYLEGEMAVLGDETLTRELDLLATLTQEAPRTNRGATDS